MYCYFRWKKIDTWEGIYASEILFKLQVDLNYDQNVDKEQRRSESFFTLCIIVWHVQCYTKRMPFSLLPHPQNLLHIHSFFWIFKKVGRSEHLPIPFAYF